jgi:hypothetical protein
MINQTEQTPWFWHKSQHCSTVLCINCLRSSTYLANLWATQLTVYLRVFNVGNKAEVDQTGNGILQGSHPSNERLPLHNKVQINSTEKNVLKKRLYFYHRYLLLVLDIFAIGLNVIRTEFFLRMLHNSSSTFFTNKMKNIFSRPVNFGVTVP